MRETWDALAERVRESVHAGAYTLSDHARQDRMKQRGVSHADVRHALVRGRIVEELAHPSGPRWKIRGPCESGVPLQVVVALAPAEGDRARVVVVTVMWPQIPLGDAEEAGT